jgi:hypothetical protein
MLFRLTTRRLPLPINQIYPSIKRTFGKDHHNNNNNNNSHDHDDHGEEEPIVEPEGNLFNRIVTIKFLFISSLV